MNRTNAQRKKYAEVHSFSGNSGRAKILNTHDRRSLKRLEKGKGWKGVEQLTKMLNQGHKKIYPRITFRELKEMGSRSCGVTRKPLVSKANKKKQL